MTQAGSWGSRWARWVAFMKYLQIVGGLEFNMRELFDTNLHLKAGCTFAGAAKIFGNGVPWLDSSASLQTSIKTLSADRKLWDR